MPSSWSADSEKGLSHSSHFPYEAIYDGLTQDLTTTAWKLSYVVARSPNKDVKEGGLRDTRYEQGERER